VRCDALGGAFLSPMPEPVRNPRLTPLGFTEVIFGLSPRYGIHTALDANRWFLSMMREHEEFEVETDRAGEWPVPFWSETVRGVMVE